jgi:hypothetical protein
MKLTLQLLRWRVYLGFGILTTKDFYQRGYTNKCKNGQYIVFLDYDNVPIDWVKQELTYLIQKCKLGDFHLFETNKGYHAVCTDKFGLGELVQLLRKTSTDAAYINVPLRGACRAWTLRLTKKEGKSPKYLLTLKGSKNRMQSKPHNDVLRTLYKIPIQKKKEDGENTLIISGYYKQVV